MKRSLSFLLIIFIITISTNLNACLCGDQAPYFCQPIDLMRHTYLVVVTDTLISSDLEVVTIDSIQHSTIEVYGEINTTETSQNYQVFKDNIISCFSMEVASHEIEKEADQLIVFPNPAIDYLFIDLKINSIQTTHLDLLNSKGQILKSNLNFEAGKSKLKINDLQNNQLYFLRVKTKTGIIIRKFIKT